MGRETHLIRQRPFQWLTQSSHDRKSDPDQGVCHRPWPTLAPNQSTGHPLNKAGSVRSPAALNASMPASELTCSVQGCPISTVPPSGHLERIASWINPPVQRLLKHPATHPWRLAEASTTWLAWTIQAATKARQFQIQAMTER
ncbi:hypothetical protein ACLOJK_007159 [Asimina triloba]